MRQMWGVLLWCLQTSGGGGGHTEMTSQQQRKRDVEKVKVIK